MTDPTPDIAELRELLERATPAPWGTHLITCSVGAERGWASGVHSGPDLPPDKRPMDSDNPTNPRWWHEEVYFGSDHRSDKWDQMDAEGAGPDARLIAALRNHAAALLDAAEERDDLVVENIALRERVRELEAAIRKVMDEHRFDYDLDGKRPCPCDYCSAFAAALTPGGGGET